MLFNKSSILSILAGLQFASAACNMINGNYYCGDTDAIIYSGVGYSGSYMDVISMDESTCKCTQQSYGVSGALSPLDEELSVHFRGPLKLVQFGVYYPQSSSNSKRDAEPEAEPEADCTTTKHVHHMHRRAPAVEIVQVTETVFVDGQGNSITSSSTQVEVTNGVPTDSSVSLVTGNAATTVANTPVTSSSSSPSSSSSSSSSSSAAASSGSAASGDWVRSSYYTPGSTDNLTFLNTLGGSAGSGTWSSCFGNSLSYCAANGVDAAGSAQALNEVTVGSNVEYLIMSGSSCSGNDCGYYREGIPAYHGFGGSQKIFVFEFQMPSDSGSSALNGDMPAIWMLNAKIPRTLQYGDSSCSCWSTGCGELDLFEVLSSGEGADKLISHIHSGQGSNGSSQGGGGSQYYFDRPYTGTMKAAIIFDNGNISIVKLDDSTSFDSSISSSVVSSWENTSGAQYAQLL